MAASLTDIRDRISLEWVPHKGIIGRGGGRLGELRSIPWKGDVHNAGRSCRDLWMFVSRERGAAGRVGGSGVVGGGGGV